LEAEIARLEKISSGVAAGAAAPSPLDRYNAFLALARLNQLSGNHETALKAYEGALALFPNDGRVLLEQGRFLISVGEYERAGAALSALLNRERDRELMIQGRYLAALLMAFGSGDTRYLAAMAEEQDFGEYHSGIYYTLWRLTGLASYRDRLVAEFPQSPEAKIIGGTVNFAAIPLWLLFPGRDSIALAVPAPSPAAATPAAATPTATPPAAAQAGRLLQIGLFGREENAVALGEQLRRVGFEPQIIQRQVSGTDRWAVCVNGGSDMNAMIKRLKDAGFEAFPIQ